MIKSTIESVTEAVGQWRKSGIRRLPRSLWQEIFSLEPTHSLLDISEATGISKQYLVKKFRKRRPGFVEVKLARKKPSPTETFAATAIEVRRPDGTEIRMQISSSDATKFLQGLLQ